MFNFPNFIKKEFSNEKKESIRKMLKTFLFFLPHRCSLNILALKHGTDKKSIFGGHGYVKHYQRYFSSIRRKKVKILEIGIGGYSDPKAGGGSLRMWEEYFPRSMIYGIDIQDKSCLESRRVKVFTGSQNDPAFLKKVTAEIGQIDIVIDDGSHINEHVITSFHVLFPYLADGGIYAIEDVQTSYMPQFGGNWENLNDTGTTTMGMVKSLVDGINYKYIPNRTPTYFDENVASIHFYPNIAFIFKGKNKYALSDIELKDLARAKCK